MLKYCPRASSNFVPWESRLFHEEQQVAIARCSGGPAPLSNRNRGIMTRLGMSVRENIKELRRSLALMLWLTSAAVCKTALAGGEPVPDCVPPGGVAHATPTEHFLLMSDTDRELSRMTAGRLERVYDAVMFHLRDQGVQVVPSKERLNVVLYDDAMVLAARAKRSGLDGAGVALLGGFYDAGANAVYLARVDRSAPDASRGSVPSRDPASSRDSGAAESNKSDSAKDASLLTAQHEVVHLLLANVVPEGRGASLPTWLAEGLACQFEGDLSKPLWGDIVGNRWRAADLRAALGLAAGDYRANVEQVEQGMRERKLLPIGTLLGRADALHVTSEHSAYYYAEAWAAVLFLRISKADLYGKLLRGLLNEPAADHEPVAAAALEAAFGGSDPATTADWIGQILRHHVDRDGTIR